MGVRYFDILFRYSRLHLSQLMWLCDDNHQSRVSGEWSGGGQAAVFIPGVWRHHTRQLGPDIISTVISVIILIMKTFHISIASLYQRQCRGCDDVNHRSGIRTDTTCHNRYTPVTPLTTAQLSDDIKYYFILPAVNMNCADIC